MAMFWHNHFATAYSKLAADSGTEQAAKLLAAKPGSLRGPMGQIELFREYGMGSYRDLLFRVAQDAAIVIWLDGQFNTRAKPQENFGREIMELFSVGVGYYTEPDVYAAARVFSGWNLRESEGYSDNDMNAYKEFVYNADQHETSEKTFSFPIYSDGSKTIPPAANRRDAGRDRSDHGAGRHPETARRLARKFWNFFISEIVPPDPAFVSSTANVYLQSGTRIGPVVYSILNSPWFNDPSAYHARYSWPAEFVVRAIKEGRLAELSRSTRRGRRSRTWGRRSTSRPTSADGRFGAGLVLHLHDAGAIELRRHAGVEPERASWRWACSAGRVRRSALMDGHARACHAGAVRLAAAAGAPELPRGRRRLDGQRIAGQHQGRRARATAGRVVRIPAGLSEGRHEDLPTTVHPRWCRHRHHRARGPRVPGRHRAGAGHSRAPARGRVPGRRQRRAQHADPVSGRRVLQPPPHDRDPAGQVLQVGTDAAGRALGLHPRLTALRSIFNEGRLALVQRTGTRTPAARTSRRATSGGTANPQNSTGSGWLGRYLDTLPRPVDALAAWNTTDETPRALKSASPACRRSPTPPPTNFASPNQGVAAQQERNTAEVMAVESGGGASASGAPERRQPRRHRNAGPRGAGAHLRADGRLSEQRLRAGAAHRSPAPSCKGIGSKVYWVSTAATTRTRSRARTGGGPTQPDGHAGDGLGAFYTDIRNQGLSNDTTVIVFSEFGRRISENGSGGPTRRGGRDDGARRLGARRAARHGRVAGARQPDARKQLRRRALRDRLPIGLRRLLDNWLGVNSVSILNGDFKAGARPSSRSPPYEEADSIRCAVPSCVSLAAPALAQTQGMRPATGHDVPLRDVRRRFVPAVRRGAARAGLLQRLRRHARVLNIKAQMSDKVSFRFTPDVKPTTDADLIATWRCGSSTPRSTCR
jgi:uncharacterized protein (DUF1501 family)